MSYILFHGSQESLKHIADRIKHHRSRRSPVPGPRCSPPHALIVDDDVESIQPLQTVLRGYGFDTTIAFDGKDAFEKISTSAFDIVFLDICMPEMTGLEVLQQVENFQNHDSKYFKREHLLPVVTYSSHPMAEYDIPDGKRFFFAGHWKKPVTLGDLTSLTGHALQELRIGKKQSQSRKWRAS